MTPLVLSGFTVRLAGPADRDRTYAVCLQTGDSGRDATALHSDPEALGNVYVGAYLRFEPEFAFVLEDAGGVCGYTLGARDTKRFQRRYVEEWLPPLRARHPAPTGARSAWTRDQQVWHLLHEPDLFLPERYAEFPSHLHIDLLPRAQGRGLGKALMALQLGALHRAGSPGVHLAMAIDNGRALGFYRQLGFHELSRTAETRYLAKRLP